MRHFVRLGILSLLVTASAISHADTRTIEVGHNRLHPAELTISVGDVVTFRNTDTMPGGHTLVADDKSFTSPPLAKDASWSHTFSEAGIFQFHIKQHRAARGKITVQEK